MKVALIIIYNHRYDKNIEKLENLYKGRFSKIYHIIPFYTGDKLNVIPVYENSIFFEGYVAQGMRYFYDKEFTHYFFVPDDMIIHPNINENNYFEYFHLKEQTSYLPRIENLYSLGKYWPHLFRAFAFRLTKWGVEAKNELPSYEEAEKKMLKNGVLKRPLKEEIPLKWKDLNQKWRWNFFRKENREKFFHWLSDAVSKKRYSLNYPLTTSYSDIFIASSKDIHLFCHYCGVFAAFALFHEIAVPSALALASDEIVTEDDLPIKGKPLWEPEDFQFLSPYRNDLDLLMKNYPDVLYIHPIKLSQWKSERLSKTDKLNNLQ